MAQTFDEDVVVTKKQVYWLNPQKKKIPLEAIKEEDVSKDMFVSGLVERARKLRDYIKSEKEAMTNDLNGYLLNVAHKLGEKDWAGNVQLSDFGHLEQVCRKMGRYVTFDETLQIAKQKIDKCIIKWGGTSNANLVSIINSTFDVNQSGKLDVQNILSLQKLQITGDDETVTLWKEAMQIITDSTNREFSKAYLYFREKDSLNEWKTIPLDFSSL